MQKQLRDYVVLTKPGIVTGNALIAVGSYLFAAHGEGDWRTFLFMLGGVYLVMAAACVVNNIIDQDIDAIMTRTKKRALAAHTVSTWNASLFALVLFVISMLLFALGTNILTLLLGVFGFIMYAGVYTYSKRKTIHSTLIGTISGAVPPLIGYSAFSGHLDLAAWLLFVILVAWQMPHFFSIAIFRHDDYKAAKVPVISVVRGLEATRRQIIGYTTLYVLASVVLGIWGGLSLFSALILLLSGLYWLYLCALPTEGDMRRWGLRQFLYSLSLLYVLALVLSLDNFWH
jgi:protoheme IX farnesyltransferase